MNYRLKFTQMLNEDADQTSLQEIANGVEPQAQDLASASKEAIKEQIAAGVAEDLQAKGVDASDVAVNTADIDAYAERIANLGQLATNPIGASSASAAQEALSLALRSTVRGIQDRVLDTLGGYYNVILQGLPGYAKTATTNAFCKKYKLNLVKVDASTLAKETIGGIPYPKKELDGRLTQAPVASKIWDALDKPKSVLFLDEFNTATPDIMGSLLKLINDHELPAHVEDENGNLVKTMKKFPNLLFTVIAANPYHPDLFPNNTDLTMAMSSRFARNASVGPDNIQFLKYVSELYSSILALPLAPDRYAMYAGQFEIAKALLTNKKFHFDELDNHIEIVKARARDYRTYSPLNYRSFMLQLTMSDGTKADFLSIIRSGSSGFVQQTKDMIDTVLANYTDKPTTGNNVFNKANADPTITQRVNIKSAQAAATAIQTFIDSL